MSITATRNELDLETLRKVINNRDFFFTLSTAPDHMRPVRATGTNAAGTYNSIGCIKIAFWSKLLGSFVTGKYNVINNNFNF